MEVRRSRAWPGVAPGGSAANGESRAAVRWRILLSILRRAGTNSRMKILVTGGAGYIGSICVEQLLDAGHTVTVFDNLTEGHRAAVDPRATLLQGDLQNRC